MLKQKLVASPISERKSPLTAFRTTVENGTATISDQTFVLLFARIILVLIAVPFASALLLGAASLAATLSLVVDTVGQRLDLSLDPALHTPQRELLEFTMLLTSAGKAAEAAKAVDE